jgi:hypothetical protein
MDLAALFAAAGSATQSVDVPLGDAKVTVLPQMDWKYSGIEAVQRGDFREWARSAFAIDNDGRDGAEQWSAADPTVRQLVDFFSDYADATGISLGK